MYPKKATLSKHAEERLLERGISIESVEKILSEGAKVGSSPENVEYRLIVEEKLKPYLYRVFVNEQKDLAMIIPVYKTSKINKYP